MTRCRKLAESFLRPLPSCDLLHFSDDLSSTIAASDRELARLFTIRRDRLVEKSGLLKSFKAIGIQVQCHLQAFLNLGKISIFRALQFYRSIHEFERLDPVG